MSSLPQFMIDDGCEVVVDEHPRLNPKSFITFRYRMFTTQASRRLLRNEDFARKWWEQTKAGYDQLAEKYYRHDSPPA